MVVTADAIRIQVDTAEWIVGPGGHYLLTVKGSKHVEELTRVCSLLMTDARPEAVAAWIQGHGGIESRLHVGP